MGKTSSLLAAGCLAAMLIGFVGEPRAQDGGEKPDLGWSTSTELNLVVTEGNANSNSIGFKNTTRRRWKDAILQVKLDAYEFNESDDRFLLVDPGVTWLPGEDPPADPPTTVVEPGVEPDVARYFIEGKYTREISNKFFWNTGLSWDRNEDAGILNRYRTFGGLGNQWKDVEGLHFATSYGLSYTNREEESPDPEKDDQFMGVRLDWDYLNKFGKHTKYENDFTTHVSLEDTGDFSMMMDNSIAVTMTEHLTLRVGLKFQYENEPALEDVDIIGRVIVVDEDGDPGSGDEFFETVDSGGAKIEFGEDRIRKKQLDVTFTTGLVITF